MMGGRGRVAGGGGRGGGRASRRLPGVGEEEEEPEVLEDKGFSNGKTILVLAIVVT